MLPKPPAICPSAVSRQSCEHPERSRSTATGSALLDDQRARRARGRAARGCRRADDTRSARIGRRELVDKAFAGLDRRLGQARHAVHGVRQADAVPVNRGVLVQPVLDDDADRLALPQAQHGAGYGTVIGPYSNLAAVRAGERSLAWRHFDPALIDACCPRPCGARQRRRR